MFLFVLGVVWKYPSINRTDGGVPPLQVPSSCTEGSTDLVCGELLRGARVLNSTETWRKEQDKAAAMKTILASETMDIPPEVKLEVKARKIKVEGPRGKLFRDFKHLHLDFQIIEDGKKLQVDAWFGSRKTMAAIRTAISHISNLIKGVTVGFKYKMRLVYAHFPINSSINGSSDCIEIRNFLGEKKVRGDPTFVLPQAASLRVTHITVGRFVSEFQYGAR